MSIPLPVLWSFRVAPVTSSPPPDISAPLFKEKSPLRDIFESRINKSSIRDAQGNTVFPFKLAKLKSAPES